MDNDTLTAILAADDGTTFEDWFRARGSGRFSQTLAAVATRVNAGEPFMPCAREFLDEYKLRPPEQKADATLEEPAPVGDTRFDVFLAALAEHLCLRAGTPVPGWATEPHRTLERMWFVSDIEGFRSTQLAASPPAFRRRGIMVHPGALERF